MSWDFDFQARPLKLNVKRTTGIKTGRRYVLLYTPDAVYRKVTRRIVGRLLDENAALRRDVNRPPSTFARALVWALRQALRRQP